MTKKTKRTRQKERHTAPKRTKQNEPISAVKRTKTILGIAAIEDRHLAWRFSICDLSGPFSWNHISNAERQAVWTRMAEFEKMTIPELKAAKCHHGVPLSNISKKSKERLRQLQLDDQDNLWSFRVSSKPRFWCIKHENIYALLWWDPDHQVYPITKTRT